MATLELTNMLLIEADPIAVAGLIVAIIAVLIAIPAAWGAVRALKYAKAAPTADDLARVEGNTRRTAEHLEGVKQEVAEVKGHSAATSEHLRKQGREKELNARANLVSVAVRGRGYTDDNFFEAQIAVRDASVYLVRIDLLSENGIQYGSSNCVKTEGGPYLTLLERGAVARWFQSGQISQSWNNAQLRIRLHFEVADNEMGQKEMPVVLHRVRVKDTRVEGQFVSEAWEIDGEV